MTNKPGYKQLRKGRSSEVGSAYHITFAVHNRLKLFSNFYTARLLISIMHREDVLSKCDTLAFVVMPDHIHWLLVLKSGGISALVQQVKSLFSKCYGRKIWQDGFYDHGIRDDEALINVARYIVANPLRAKIVSQVGCYPHWDSVWL
ncbi:REP-associated tyrosine transposase [Colwellia echini]|uniref:Transposase n=1 Tax=Colwellia echini TaxID=1982103 RepID=A0ABY3MXW3_9GAMM|nr:transposase [Colwellia echini]TYK65996.1 transposase [Colwellia echini]